MLFAIDRGLVISVLASFLELAFCTRCFHDDEKSGIAVLGLKTLIYFEIMAFISLLLGIVAADILKPGTGLNIDPSMLESSAIQHLVPNASSKFSIVDFLLNIIPESVFGAFVHNDFLQVLLIAILFGISLRALGAKAKPLADVIVVTNQALFKVIGVIVKLAPIAAFSSISFTIGKYGLTVFSNLFALIMALYLAAAFFIFVILGMLCWVYGINYLKFLKPTSQNILYLID